MIPNSKKKPTLKVSPKLHFASIQNSRDSPKRPFYKHYSLLQKPMAKYSSPFRASFQQPKTSSFNHTLQKLPPKTAQISLTQSNSRQSSLLKKNLSPHARLLNYSNTTAAGTGPQDSSTLKNKQVVQGRYSLSPGREMIPTEFNIFQKESCENLRISTKDQILNEEVTNSLSGIPSEKA